MSVDIMSMVFKRYPDGGGEMLLALALADHAHDDGTHIYPSIKHLAVKTRQSERSVQYQLRKMEECGWLILVNSGNGGRSQHREYRISGEWIKGAEIAPIKKGANDDKKGAISDAKGAIDDKKGCNPLHPHITIKNHQETSKNRQAASKGTRLPTEWVLPKAWGEWALSEFPAWDADNVRRTATMFKNHWIAKPGRDAVKLDWFATWQNWCLKEPAVPAGARAAGGGAWWATPEAKLAKAKEVGVGAAHPGEDDKVWTARIQAAINNGGKPPVVRPIQAVTIATTEPKKLEVSLELAAQRSAGLKAALQSKPAAHRNGNSG